MALGRLHDRTGASPPGDRRASEAAISVTAGRAARRDRARPARRHRALSRGSRRPRRRSRRRRRCARASRADSSTRSEARAPGGRSESSIGRAPPPPARRGRGLRPRRSRASARPRRRPARPDPAEPPLDLLARPGRRAPALWRAFERMAETPARLYLLAADGRGRSPTGSRRSACSDRSARTDVTAFATGPAGTWSRLLAPRLGAPVVYGRLRERAEAGRRPCDRLSATTGCR